MSRQLDRRLGRWFQSSPTGPSGVRAVDAASVFDQQVTQARAVWGSGQPDNAAAGCVQVMAGAWSDRDCDFVFPLLCEFDDVPVDPGAF